MNVRLLATVALAAAAAIPRVASASPTPVGEGCGSILTTRDGTAVGVIRGGPVAVPGAAAVTLTCTVIDYFDDSVLFTTSSDTHPGATVLEPRVVQFPMDSGLYNLCSTLDVDGTTWYENNGWTTVPDTSCRPDPWPPLGTVYDALPPEARPAAGYALCMVDAMSPVHFYRTTCDSTEVIEQVGGLIEPVDDAACEAFRAARPGAGPVEIREDGDVYVDGGLWWDCKPYEPGS